LGGFKLVLWAANAIADVKRALKSDADAKGEVGFANGLGTWQHGRGNEQAEAAWWPNTSPGRNHNKFSWFDCPFHAAKVPNPLAKRLLL